MISITQLFKIGIGPSSSHTLGPMNAARDFVKNLQEQSRLMQVTHMYIDLYGSLAMTGKGHQTDRAIILGLAGFWPESLDLHAIPAFFALAENQCQLALAGTSHKMNFDANEHIIFNSTSLALHENGVRFRAFNGVNCIAETVYYSIGGGFVVKEEDFDLPSDSSVALPFPFTSAASLLNHTEEKSLSIAELVMQNELAIFPASVLTAHLKAIWKVTLECVNRGLLSKEVHLPGPLGVPRRAPALHEQLQAAGDDSNDPLKTLDWLNLFALAASEENAAGGRVVTAPTNGACGIMPAVLLWYDTFIMPVDNDMLTTWFMTAGAIGSLYKMNASISGAEVGCQGEVGVACSMAAAALAALWGGTPQQVCTAAEIGMEHHLGLTCDPISGQVQVPCIERNAIAAVKAVNAARIALRRESTPCVSLDDVIEAMYRTGKDMHVNYRETSQGGLAVVVLPKFCR